MMVKLIVVTRLGNFNLWKYLSNRCIAINLIGNGEAPDKLINIKLNKIKSGTEYYN